MRKTLLVGLLVAMHWVVPINAADIQPYTDPLPLGGYIDDVDALLVSSFKHHGWQVKARHEGWVLAFISYKGYDISVRVDVKDDAVVLRRVSTFETGCTEPCTDIGEAKVIQWLVNLRRTIAYELTLAIRSQLQEQVG